MADNFLNRLLGNFRASEYVNQTKSTIDSTSNPMIMGWQTPSGYISNIDQMDDGFTNSAVTACLNVLSTSFIEPELQVCRYVDGEHEYLYDHELKKLYYEPNPYMSGDLLAKYIVTAIATQGDAYLLKNRTDGGRVVELYPLISQYVTPKGNKENLITHYEYAPQYMNAVNFERDDIVHIRQQINPLNHKVGYAPLQSVLREIIGDESAGQFAVALLQNMGIPSVIMMPKGDIPLSAEEAQQISETYQRRFGGQNRGKPLILTGGEMDIKPVSFSPSDLDIGKLRQIPEERISAVLGVPAILAGLGAGLERATYSNARELREYFTETRMVPLWKTVSQAITNQLLKVDYGEEDTFVKYDTSTVRAFQTDEKELYDRLNVAVQGGWLTLGEARRSAGFDAGAEHDVYLIPSDKVVHDINLEPTTENVDTNAGKILDYLIQGKSEVETTETTEVEFAEDYTEERKAWEWKFIDDLKLIWEDFVNKEYTKLLGEQRRWITGEIEKSKTINEMEDVTNQLVEKYNDMIWESALKEMYFSVGNDFALQTQDTFNPQKAEEPFQTEPLTPYNRRKPRRDVLESGYYRGRQTMPTDINLLRNRDAIDVMEANLKTAIKEINDTTAKRIGLEIRKAVSEASELGIVRPTRASHPDIFEKLEKSIANTLKKDQVWRAKMIAETEVGKISSYARDRTAKKNGAKQKQWVTMRDQVVRDTHRLLDGVRIDFDELYYTSEGSLERPHDSKAPAKLIINCRCTQVYYKDRRKPRGR